MKYSNLEYDIISSAKDQRLLGVSCEGQVLLKPYEPENVIVEPTNEGNFVYFMSYSSK